MPKNWLVRLLIAAVAGLSIGTAAACETPDVGTRYVIAGEALAQELNTLTSQDASLQQLQQLGYTPTTVTSDGKRRHVTYRLCEGAKAEECANKVEPDKTKAKLAVHLFTTTAGLKTPIIFNGGAWLEYPQPENLEPANGHQKSQYKLYCTPVAAPAPTPTPLPSALAPKLLLDYISQFKEAGNLFGALKYSRNGTFTHLDTLGGKTWECIAAIAMP